MTKPKRDLTQLPCLWHGAYCEHTDGAMFLFGRDGEAQMFTDPDELWLRLIEISQERGALRPTARIPTMPPTKPREETIANLVKNFQQKGGTITKGPSPRLRGKPKPKAKLTLKLSVADLDL